MAADKRYKFVNNGWYLQTGCGCGGKVNSSGEPLSGVDWDKLLTYTQPTPTTVIGGEKNYQVHTGFIILDFTPADFEQFKADPRFRVPSDAEKRSMFGTTARLN